MYMCFFKTIYKIVKYIEKRLNKSRLTFSINQV